MNLKNKITILVHTHNRHKYLGRLLDYYTDTKIPIIVCDSSNDEFFLENKNEFFRYFFYMNKSYGSKLKDVIKK